MIGKATYPNIVTISQNKENETPIEYSDRYLKRLLVLMKFSKIDDQNFRIGSNKELISQTNAKNTFFEGNNTAQKSFSVCNSKCFKKRSNVKVQLCKVNERPMTNKKKVSNINSKSKPKCKLKKNRSYESSFPKLQPKESQDQQSTGKCHKKVKSHHTVEIKSEQNLFAAITKPQLANLLTQKPKPNWGKRLFLLKKFDKTLVVGNPENLVDPLSKPSSSSTQPIKIIINKNIFPLLIEITKGIKKNDNFQTYKNAYKSCQRGLIEWFRRKKFQNKVRYSRDRMEFVPMN
ncbi:hypothetical protein M0812_02557 [Anaeramoeba flamelloides]|uniref:Uncharacterized protein n=1 Tax=Anaeramoeba flamelloides TaxID=1746091 RepID=A0AAV7YQB6_9EUKA|nr:hypothetical protein M0812_02557 [Anaeramoeba flamelloides]